MEGIFHIPSTAGRTTNAALCGSSGSRASTVFLRHSSLSLHRLGGDLLRKLRQLFVCLFFLFQSLLQQRHMSSFAELFGHGSNRTVAGHLIVFNTLCSSDDRG